MTEISRIIAELEEQVQAINAALNALRGVQQPKRRGRPPAPGKTRNLSEEGRRRIAEAQRQRWAHKHAEEEEQQTSGVIWTPEKRAEQARKIREMWAKKKRQQARQQR